MAERFFIHLGNDVSCWCDPGESLLAALGKAGVDLVSVGCRGGGCGVCRVRVISGRYQLGKVSRAHCSEADQAEGLTLACRLYPESDLEVIVQKKQ